MVVLSLSLSGLLLAATLSDLTQFKIPNVIPILVVALALVKIGIGMEVEPLIAHFLLFALVLVLGLLAFAARLLGGGDVKLIAALALWFEPAAFASFITITGLAGGLLALLLLAARRPAVIAAMGGSGHTPSSLQPLLDPKAPVPYALPIAFAALWLEWS